MILGYAYWRFGLEVAVLAHSVGLLLSWLLWAIVHRSRGHGGGGFTTLADNDGCCLMIEEVRFNLIPEPATLTLFGVAIFLLLRHPRKICWELAESVSPT